MAAFWVLDLVLLRRPGIAARDVPACPNPVDQVYATARADA
jgi:hypothetical protein